MLRERRFSRHLAMLGVVLLAGCAEAQLVAHTAKEVQGPTDSGQVGGYKVGSPYQVGDVWYYPKVDYEYRESGIASWYGPGFDGKPTANGETFDANALTAAHRTLPLPSMVRITNLENGRSLKVRVNDRGPFAHGRIIDVSRRAAKLLGFEGQGTAKVMVEMIEGESRRLAALARGDSQEGAPQAAPTVAVDAASIDDEETGVAAPRVQTAAASYDRTPEPDGVVTRRPVRPSDIYVQAGAFIRYDNANRLGARLSALGPIRVSEATVEGRRYFRVQLGPVYSVAEADQLLNRLIANGHYDAQVVVVQ
ncbi:MAG: septal ring lytic transglycosylase RlpA family protein [Rhodovibrionaceae bacterium]|nr:septal ring lytic transglycosylase RlpA family protein [Rhodovibrionaceae bacterium]